MGSRDTEGITKELSKRAKDVYDFLMSFIAEYQVVPTRRQIADGACQSSTSQVQLAIVELEEHGLLERPFRSLRLVGSRYTAPAFQMYAGIYSCTDEVVRTMFTEKYGYPPAIIKRDQPHVIKAGPIIPAD